MADNVRSQGREVIASTDPDTGGGTADQHDEKLGTFVFSPDPAHTEIAALAGFDFVIVDCEHAPMAVGDVLGHVRAAASSRCSVMVRSTFADLGEVTPFLDMGVAGIVLPHAGRDVGHTRDVLQALRFPPRGRRAACSGVRAAGYGLRDFASYARQADQEVLGWGLIEDLEVLDDLDAILTECQFDAVIPGPGDLAASLGLPGQLTHPDVVACVDRIIAAAHRVEGCQVGMYVTSPSEIERWRARGVDFFAYSIDYRILAASMRQAVHALRERPSLAGSE